MNCVLWLNVYISSKNIAVGYYYIVIKYNNNIIIVKELQKLRAKMESYKALNDAGKLLPQDTDDWFYPGYVAENSEFKSQIVDWMVEYSVPGNHDQLFFCGFLWVFFNSD